jgi:thiol:disulfide interchange protein DsbD
MVPGSEVGRLGEVLQSGRGWRVAAVFLLAGLLLSLTPCVLPMMPILSSVIVGHGRSVTRGRGLALAAAYSLGMALVYTAVGVAAGLAGEGLAATLQTPAVLWAFALGLVALALSMFGLYELQLPGFITQRLTRTSQGLPAGDLLGVGVMGGVSALLVSPCVAAPLAGALVYISQTRDAALGGLALFSLAAGMSVPLLLIGASAGALLPRAGVWMDDVKRFFGVLLVGVALWTVQSLLPAGAVLAAWGSWLLFLAVFLGAPRPAVHARHAAWRRTVRQGLALVLGVAGVLQWVGAASGGTDPLQPLAVWASARGRAGATPPTVQFQAVRTVAEFDAAVARAGRPVMLDFYADWCVSCKEMERFTFADAQVRARLGGALLLRADVTANHADDRALLKRFGLFGPPGTLFFDAQGREIAAARVIGYQDAARFLKTLLISGL